VIAPLAQGWAATSKRATTVTPNILAQDLGYVLLHSSFAEKHYV